MSVENIKIILRKKFEQNEILQWQFYLAERAFNVNCDGTWFKIPVAELEAYGYGTKINLTIEEYVDHLLKRHKKKMQLAEEVMAFYKKRKEELGL